MATLDELRDWRAAGERKLDWQAARAARYFSYYDGESLVPAMLDTVERQTFRQFLQIARAPWCELVVNAVAERLQVVGFQFGGGSDRAWLIWQASGMDADGELAQTDALITGQAPVLVQPDDDNPTGVSITGESPRQACVLYQPGDRRKRAAAYKRFEDEGHHTTEVVILPDVIATWNGDSQGDPIVEDNPAGVVTMIELIPQPRTWGAPRSELKSALDLQDRLNIQLFNRLVALDYSAFRQIWATGVKMAREVLTDSEGQPETGADGKPKVRLIPPYQVGANRLLANEDPQGRFGSIPESTLAGYLAAVEQDIQQLAAITQTPPYYLQGTVANLSADAIKAAEAGLVAKVNRRALHIGEAWEEVIRLALQLVGDPAAAEVAGEVVWADIETRSEAQRVDALTKMATLGVPTQVLWERWGASPQDVRRWRQLAAEESAQQAASSAAALGAADIASLLSQAGAPGAQP